MVTRQGLYIAIVHARIRLHMPAIHPSLRLDEAVQKYACGVMNGRSSLKTLADEVHDALGEHAVAAVESLYDVRQLQGVRLPHWEEFGACWMEAGEPDLCLAVVVYARRNAWAGDRIQRAQLRGGLAAFQDAFEALYGNDQEWMAEWESGSPTAFRPLYSAAALASGFSETDFRKWIAADPLLQWTMRKFLIDRTGVAAPTEADEDGDAWLFGTNPLPTDL